MSLTQQTKPDHTVKVQDHLDSESAQDLTGSDMKTSRKRARQGSTTSTTALEAHTTSSGRVKEEDISGLANICDTHPSLTSRTHTNADYEPAAASQRVIFDERGYY
ncbi:hypothetical protein MVEN_02183500 [Mycena venus]|uniref:Uncharacterized protein n=1 Tax=Mycena venus TaxID=2733690 RepID=A0A8H6X9A7_9AGAR|nr:hypothetical protein MVEN_02183500 [Mycena venus]